MILLYDADDILAAFKEYIVQKVTKPHPSTNGMALCPFAKKAMHDDQTMFLVHPFDLEEIKIFSDFTLRIFEFIYSNQYQIMTIIHPQPDLMNVEKIQKVETNLQLLLPDDFACYADHPDDDFTIGGISVPRPPFPFIQIIGNTLVIKMTNILKETEYYNKWTASELQSVRFMDRVKRT